MYSTHVSPDPRLVTPEPQVVNGRINWVVAANAQEEARRRLFRHAREEEEMLLMRRPVSVRKAYALFGLLLGALPPAAIFGRMLGYGLMESYDSEPVILLLCLLMNVVCSLVGLLIGYTLSQPAHRAERRSWSKMLLTMPLIGAVWGFITGAVGGLFFFGFGAIFGAAFAIPIGAAAFLMFAIAHRLLERGGMIETRHFLPLACGIVAILTALILGL